MRFQALLLSKHLMLLLCQDFEKKKEQRGKFIMRVKKDEPQEKLRQDHY